MNRLLEVCLVALTLAASITPSAAARLAAGTQSSSFIGTWEGSVNGLSGINLKIQEADRSVTGNIVFYFQKPSDPNGPWHVAGESALPLLAPHFEGNTLTFEVEHHRCHGCSDLGPNVKFRMALAGANEARLWNLNDGTDSGPGLKLVRGPDASAGAAQALQKGISVQLAATDNALAMPDADHADASIVAVTADGRMYFGIDPVAPAALEEKIKTGLSSGGKQLYIKADARSPYANVMKIFEAAHTAGIAAPVLLTSQAESPAPGTVVPPKGLEVWVSPSRNSGSIVVQVLNSGHPSPTLKVNNQDIAPAALQSTLTKLLKNQSEKVVLVKVDGQVPFGDVVHVIDACRSTEAKVVLATPQL
jgi:biopolymer transport protein ExbD